MQKEDEQEVMVDDLVQPESIEGDDVTVYIDKKFDEMSHSIKENNTLQMDKVNETIEKLTGGLNQILSGMKSELEAVKDIALEKEAKIQRYEEGHDQKNIKVFLKDLLRIMDYTNSNKETSDVVTEIYEDLELLLENEGVEKIKLNVGDIYDGNAKIVKIINTIDTNEIEKDNMIFEIKKDGYFIEIVEDNYKVIRPVEIVLYKYRDK